MQILIVEDDTKIANFLRRELLQESYTVDLAKDGEEALYKIEINEYDLMVLDLMMPKINGIEVCLRVREKNISLPILILTAQDEIKTKVQGLDAGADDYITKPFSFEELSARIRALLRRDVKVRPTKLQIDNLVIDPSTRQIWRGLKEIKLTSKEYALLYYFMRNVNILLTRTEILEHVWDYNYEGFSNIVDTYIKYLRKKLQVLPSDKPLIHTIRGSGYIMRS